MRSIVSSGHLVSYLVVLLTSRLFFFQAEDGIRDYKVTGVQTCALPILTRLGGSVLFQRLLSGRREAVSLLYANGEIYARFAQWARRTDPPLGGESVLRQKIGRASCRERV